MRLSYTRHSRPSQSFPHRSRRLTSNTHVPNWHDPDIRGEGRAHPLCPELRFGVTSLPAGKRRDGLHESLERQVLPQSSGDAVLGEETRLREAICRHGRSLFERGLTFGSSGNISARLLNGGWLMTPTNVRLGELDQARLARLARVG